MSTTSEPLRNRLYQFDQHTAVEDDRLGPWQAQIAPELSGFGGAHGGYLAAIALRAMTNLAADPARAPHSLSLQLFAPVKPGVLHLHPRREYAGSSITATSLRIEQHGQATGAAHALFGLSRPALARQDLRMPEVPPPEQCQPLLDKPAPDALAGLQVEHRPAAPPLPLTGASRAELLVWMRLVEGRPLDAISTTMLADAAPPGLFAALTSFISVPSIEIAIHYATLTTLTNSPWVLAAVRTTHAGDGYVIEDGELWTTDGRLILQTRQLRRILTKQRH
jgi:acyl-CoA thioesterase